MAEGGCVGEKSMDILHPVVQYLKTSEDCADPESMDEHSTVDSSLGDYSLSSHTPFLESAAKLTDNDIDLLFQKAGLEARSDGSGDGAKRLESRGECRVGQCHLPCLQPCATIVTFTVMCCTLAMLNGALTAGYVNSVITTIEKRFKIGSSYSGLIAAAVEIGGVTSVIFVSYFGSTRHIPNWIGVGALITGCGALVFTLPHMLAPAYTITGGLNTSKISENTCKSGVGQDFIDDEEDDFEERSCIAQESGQISYVTMLIVAQVLIGIGGSPLYTLGTTYIDNHVAKIKAPSYIAFIYAFGVFGPIVGFALGALMLQYYVDLFTFDSKTLNLTPMNAHWVGAWWGGFIFIGGLLFLVSVPFYGFPKLLVQELKEMVREDRWKLEYVIDLWSGEHGDSYHRARRTSYSKNIRDFPSVIYRLLTNPVYLITCLGICCEVFIVSGFVVFLPKYLETEFGATKSMANLMTGGIAIPGAVVGILVGGHCLRQLSLTQKGAIQLTLLLNTISVTGFGLFFFLGCDNLKMAGVTVPFHNSSDTTNDLFRINLTSSCNVGCQCNHNNMEPVCGVNGLVYLSPCHAGCTRVVQGLYPMQLQNYTNCHCILNEMNLPPDVTALPMATSGLCNHLCKTLVPFMIMLFIMTFVIAGTQMPLLMITIRSVQQTDKALALGLQFVMLRLFAYIPSPIIYGNLIDSTCLLWADQCGSQGNCLVFDLVHLRYVYVGISFTLKILAAIFYFSIWILLWKQNGRSAETANNDEEELQQKNFGIVVVENRTCEMRHVARQPSPAEVGLSVCSAMSGSVDVRSPVLGESAV